MGHDKLRKFAENETFPCLVQPSSRDLLAEGGFFNLKDHPLKGRWAERFGGRPTVLELGCGKGEYTIALASRNPDKSYVGVDIKGARLWKGARHATLNSMDNVAFLRTRIEFISAFFAPGEVDQIWLTFSDPQMKSENSRLTSPLFLARYAGFLAPGGKIHLKTDSRFLYEYTSAVCRVNGLRVDVATTDLYADRPSGVEPEVMEVQTFYESMFLDMGLPINYMEFSLGDVREFRHPSDPSEFDSRLWREREGDRRSFGHAPSDASPKKERKNFV